MLFHTLPFLVFMLVVLPGFYALRTTPLRIPWLLTASYVFYGWWNPYYLILIVYSTTLDYLLVALMDHCPARRDGARERESGSVGEAAALSASTQSVHSVESVHSVVAGRDAETLQTHAEFRRDRTLTIALVASVLLVIALVASAVFGPATLRPTLVVFTILVLLMATGAYFASRKVWLFISIVNNLALLLFFKYARFIVDNLNVLLRARGVQLADPSSLMPYGAAYLLPVGISFFTFQSMSYTIDFYLGKAQRERNILRFATFVCFFPQLMAGPIERARQMLPQFQRTPEFRIENLTDGLSLFLVGLFKKLALAGYLSIYADRIYDNPSGLPGSTLLMATFAFAWQIFFDFSGYTDMARGVARMMGYDLMLNFNNPYLATGLGNFWQRWHISLSTWFRDYVYIPLGGNRRGTLVTYRNLFITFLVSGIWHGASWNFAIWGLMHGVGVMVTRELERSAVYRDRIPKLVKQAATFGYVCIAWVFFRAATLPDAALILRRIFTDFKAVPQVPGLMLLMVGLIWAYEFVYESRCRPFLARGYVRVALAVCMALYLCFCASGGGAFIYFQF